MKFSPLSLFRFPLESTSQLADEFRRPWHTLAGCELRKFLPNSSRVMSEIFFLFSFPSQFRFIDFLPLLSQSLRSESRRQNGVCSGRAVCRCRQWEWEFQSLKWVFFFACKSDKSWKWLRQADANELKRVENESDNEMRILPAVSFFYFIFSVWVLLFYRRDFTKFIYGKHSTD